MSGWPSISVASSSIAVSSSRASPPVVTARAATMPAQIAAEDEPRPAAVRDAVGADDLQAARLPAEQVEGGAQGAYEQMVLVARKRVGALTGDVDVQAGVGDPDDDVVVEAQREPQGVVAGAEVGAGGGNAHADSRGAERGTGHLPMTLLGWLTRFPVDRGERRRTGR